MALLGQLSDVEVPAAELQRASHDPLLVVEGGARQVEVDLVATGLLPAGRPEREVEARVVTRRQGDSVIGDVAVEQPRPEAGQSLRVDRVDAERHELNGHRATLGRSATARQRHCARSCWGGCWGPR